MQPLGVVELEILANPYSGRARVGVVGELDLLVRERAPQALGEDGIVRAALAIHADLHPSALHQRGQLQAGELAALVGIPDRWRCAAHGHRACRQHQRQLQCVRQRPAHHRAAVPIQDRHQLQPAVPQADRGDGAPPDLLWWLRRHAAQQIGRAALLSCSVAELGAGTDPRHPQLAPIALDPLTIDRTEIVLQQDDQLARAIQWGGRVQLVDPMLDGHLLWRWRHGLIVQAASAAAEHVGRGAERQSVWGVIEQPAPLGMTQDGNLLFRQLTWVVSRPISA